MDYHIGTKVILPFNETGTIVRIGDTIFDWFPYKVKIRKAVFNKTNQILSFKKDQLQKEL